MRKQQLVIIEQVKPLLDCGQFFIKRCINFLVDLQAHVFADDNEFLRAVDSVKHESGDYDVIVNRNFNLTKK